MQHYKSHGAGADGVAESMSYIRVKLITYHSNKSLTNVGLQVQKPVDGHLGE